MLTKTRRRHWLPAVCAFGVLLPAVALNLRSDRATTSDHPQKSAPLHERLRYIVQAASAELGLAAAQGDLQPFLQLLHSQAKGK